MASESFVLVINIHQSCCKSLVGGEWEASCILLPPRPQPPTLLQKASLNLPLSFSAGSTPSSTSSSSIFLPSGFSLSAFISCVAMALLRRASERRRKRDQKMKGIIKKGVYSTSSQPSVSLWDVRIHSLRYRGGGVGDSCLLTSGRGRVAAADQTWRKQWRAGCGDFSTKECHREQKPHRRSGWFLPVKWRRGGPAQWLNSHPAALHLVWCDGRQPTRPKHCTAQSYSTLQLQLLHNMSNV